MNVVVSQVEDNVRAGTFKHKRNKPGPVPLGKSLCASRRVELMVSDNMEVRSLPQVLIHKSSLFGKTNMSKKYGVSIVYNVAFSSADRSERGGKKLLGRRKVGAEASQLVT